MKKNVKLVYIAPIQILSKSGVNIDHYVNQLAYSIVTFNDNMGSDYKMNENLKIYCDFDGYSIFARLFPENCEIIMSNNLNDFKKQVIEKQKDEFIFIENNETLKLFTEINKPFIKKENNYYVVVDNAIDKNIKITKIKNNLKEFYGSIYNKFIRVIKLIIK